MTAMEHIQMAMQKSRTSPASAWLSEAGATSPRSSREALWASLPAGRSDARALQHNRIVTAGRSDPARGAFDMLRTRVLHHLQQNKWTSVAITSPTRGGGKSVLALNLAFSLANRPDCRTVLVDLDLRDPGLAAKLGLESPPALEGYLRGKAGLEQVLQRFGSNLAIAPNGRPVRLAAELLQSPETAAAFRDLKQRLSPDVVLCDLPPMLASDDMMAFLPNVDCVILVVEAEANTLDQVDACERELAEETNVLGVVLNKCRHIEETTAYANGA